MLSVQCKAKTNTGEQCNRETEEEYCWQHQGNKNKGGRPEIYSTREELEKDIESYYKYCVENEQPLTVIGLACYLNMTRETLNQYQKKEKFSDTIKKAKARIEMDINIGLLKGHYNSTGAIFNLKNNFGWRDRQEHKVEQDGNITINVKGV